LIIKVILVYGFKNNVLNIVNVQILKVFHILNVNNIHKNVLVMEHFVFLYHLVINIQIQVVVMLVQMVNVDG
jgi:hypothetical protein